MATSAIPTFKAALFARLAADANFTASDIQLTYGVPAVTPQREWVMLGDARPEDGTQVRFGGQQTAAMGQYRREERFTLEIAVSCTAALRESQQALTERAFTIAGYIEASLRNWTSTGFAGATVRQALVTSASLEERVSDTDRESRVVIDVACAARI